LTKVNFDAALRSYTSPNNINKIAMGAFV